MEYRFSEIVDIPALQQMMENLWRASGLPVGILDPDGAILVATGWQPICTRFHRIHPEAAQHCRESDASLNRLLARGETLPPEGYVDYLCLNGLADVAVPVVIGGRHLANLFLGQFLYEPPDEELFRRQARRFGFAEEEYIEALRQVPILTREQVRDIIAFYAHLVHFLTRLGTEKLQRLEAQRELQSREQRLLSRNEELRESEGRYRLLFSAASDATLVYDGETLAIEEVNEAASLLYGYSREELLRLLIPDLSAEPEQTVARIREAEQRRLTRIPLAHHRRRDGAVFPVEISHGIFFWQGRRKCVGMVRDISERQQMMRIKDEMLSAVSHEIRTPLTAIIGFADFLREHPAEPAQAREYLEIICREGERLKELTDNLLDLQRLRAGFGQENFESVDVAPLLKSVALLFSRSSPRHQVEVKVPDGLPRVWGDERQLCRALQNLLSNAIKYSPAGGEVRLDARRHGDFLVLCVKDQGVGIPGEFLGQIFDQFFRINHQNGQRVGGTGLGLALVKAVAQVHRGQVWAESSVGAGSSFFLSIPVHAAG